MGSKYIGLSRGDLSKLKIFEAFDLLLENTDIDDITVSMICEEAGVSRTVFYRNFSSKFEIAQQTFQMTADKHLLKVGKELTWLQSLTECYREAYAKRSFFSKSGFSGGLESGSEYGLRVRTKTLSDTAAHLMRQNSCSIPPDVDIAFQIQFFCQAENTMVRNWLTSSNPEPPDVFASKVASCIPFELRVLIDSGVSQQ